MRAGMDARDVMKDILRQVPAKQLATEMRVSLSLVYKWAEAEEVGGSGSPLERVGELIRLTQNPLIMQWLGLQAGGFFIQNPQNVRHDGPLIPLTNHIVQEFADMLATIAQSAADDVIDEHEAKRIRSRWEQLKSVTEGFVQAAEIGNFSALREASAAGKSHPPAGKNTEG